MTVGREIEDIQALISEAGGSAFVFGHSSGSVLSLEAAASGLAIPKLAMYEPPFMVDNSRPPLPKDYREHLGELLTSGRRGDAVEYFMTIAVGVPPPAVAQMRQSPSWAKMESAAHTLPYDQAIMDRATEGRVCPAAVRHATMPCWFSTEVRARHGCDTRLGRSCMSCRLQSVSRSRGKPTASIPPS